MTQKGATLEKEWIKFFEVQKSPARSKYVIT